MCDGSPRLSPLEIDVIVYVESFRIELQYGQPALPAGDRDTSTPARVKTERLNPNSIIRQER